MGGQRYKIVWMSVLHFLMDIWIELTLKMRYLHLLMLTHKNVSHWFPVRKGRFHFLWGFCQFVRVWLKQLHHPTGYKPPFTTECNIYTLLGLNGRFIMFPLHFTFVPFKANTNHNYSAPFATLSWWSLHCVFNINI